MDVIRKGPSDPPQDEPNRDGLWLHFTDLGPVAEVGLFQDHMARSAVELCADWRDRFAKRGGDH